jgi:hypothetical protein
MWQADQMYFSETSVDFQQITRRYIPEDIIIHIHRCDHLEPCKTDISERYETQNSLARRSHKLLSLLHERLNTQRYGTYG